MSKNRQLFEVFKTTGARKGKAKAASAPASAPGPIAGSESVVEARPIRIPVQAPEHYAPPAVSGDAHAGPVMALRPDADADGAAAIGAVGSYDPDAHSGPVEAAPSQPRMTRPARRRTITLKFEEAAVYGVGTVLVVALAFLLGRYTSTEVEASGPESAPARPFTRRTVQAPRTPRAVNMVQPARTAPAPVAARTSAPATPRRAAPPAPKSHTLLVETYKQDRGGKAAVRKWEKDMKAAGLKDVRVLQDAAKKYYYLYVGKFAGSSDPAIARNRSKILKLSRNKLKNMSLKRLPKTRRDRR